MKIIELNNNWSFTKHDNTAYHQEGSCTVNIRLKDKEQNIVLEKTKDIAVKEGEVWFI